MLIGDSSAAAQRRAARPIEIRYIVQAALSKDPKDRHQTARALHDRLEQYVDSSFPVVCPHTALKRSTAVAGRLIDNHPRAVAWRVLLALAAIAVGIVLAWR